MDLVKDPQDDKAKLGTDEQWTSTHMFEIGSRVINILADLLSWILEQKGVSSVMHYLDNILTMDPPYYSVCLQNLRHCQSSMSTFGHTTGIRES